MANDYIKIRCKHCNEEITIAGYYPSLDLQVPEGLDHARIILEFINAHLLHHPRSVEYCADLDGDPGLEFIVESL